MELFSLCKLMFTMLSGNMEEILLFQARQIPVEDSQGRDLSSGVKTARVLMTDVLKLSDMDV